MTDKKKNENTVVIFNGARQHSFSAKKDCLVTLNAGSNVVSTEKLERLMGETGDEELDAMASESFIDMVAAGEIQLLDGDAVVEATSAKADDATGIKTGSDTIKINILELGAKDAIDVINSEAEVEVVQGYLAAENSAGEDARKTVIKAAEKAVEALTAPPKKEEE